MSDNLQNRDVRCYLTNAGRAAELKAIENNKAITITHMIIDADVLPDSADPKAVTQIANPAHSPIPAWVNAKVADGELNVISDIPADFGGFHINGIGYALADGTIYAYARGMGDYKRQATDGQNDVLRIECEIKTQNSAHITHTYDASKLYVNHFEFNEYKIAHIQAADPHTQYQRKDHAATESEIDSKTSSTLKHITLSMLWRALNNAFTGRRINTTGPLKGGRNLAGDVTLSVDRATTNQLGVTQLTDADGSSSNLAASQKLVNWLKTTLTSLINTKHSEAKAYTDTKHGQAINHANVKKGEAIAESKNYADSTKFAKSGGDLSGGVHIKKPANQSGEFEISEDNAQRGAGFKYDGAANKAELYTWASATKEWFLRVAVGTRAVLFAGEIFANVNKRVYHDDYHPSADNADKLNGKTASGIIGEAKGYTDQKHNEQQQFFDKKISDIYGGATPENLNSFLELGKEIQENDSAIMGINRELAKKLSKDQTDTYYQPKSNKLGRFASSQWDINGEQDLICRGKRALVGFSSESVGGLAINYKNDFGKITMYGLVDVISELRINNYLTRASHSKGCMVGSYNNVGANEAKTNPIYTIGSSFRPNDTELGNMFGIGYSYSTAEFLKDVKQAIGSSWGAYFTSDGTVRAFIGSSNGRMWVSDAYYEGALRLDQKYLGIKSKAKSSEDSDKLGGLPSNNYVVQDSRWREFSRNYVVSYTRHKPLLDFNGTEVGKAGDRTFLVQSFPIATGSVTGAIWIVRVSSSRVITLKKAFSDGATNNLDLFVSNGVVSCRSSHANDYTYVCRMTELSNDSKIFDYICDSYSKDESDLNFAPKAGSVDQDWHARSLILKSGETDAASIGTTVSGSSTHVDFNLADDPGGNDSYRWLFRVSGDDERVNMQLYPKYKGLNQARLNLYGEAYLGDGTKRAYHEGHKPTASDVGAVPASDMEHVGKCATANGSNEAAAGSDGYRMAMWQDVQDFFSLFSINSNKTTLTVKHDGYYKIIMAVPRRRHASGSSDQFGKLLINGVQHTKVRADSNNYDAPEIKVYAYVLLRKGNTIQYSTIGSTLATGGGFMIEYARKA